VTVERGEPAIGGSCRPELIEFAVVELEFELLIEAIPKIGADELVQGLVIAGIHLRSSVWGRSGLRFLMTFDSGVTVLVVWHAASSAGFFEVTSVAIAGPGATSFR
jgi:hypothetical protein